MITFDTAAVERVLQPIVIRIKDALPGLLFAVAGGAVRDLLMGRDVKDIDILVEQDHPLSDEQIDMLQRLFDVKFKEYDSEDVENYDDGDRTEFPVAIYVGKGVDIIVVTDIFKYVDDFPDDISKALVDTQGLVMRDGFIQAHETKTMHYRNSAGGARLQRLLAKYPYSVVHQ